MEEGKRINRFLRFLVVLSGVLAFWGWFQYDAIDHVGIAVWSALYKTLQTFLFETGFDALPVPIPLQIAVYLAPLSLAGTVLFGLISIARIWLLGTFIQVFVKGHAILAGDLDFCTKMIGNEDKSKDLKIVILLPPEESIPDNLLNRPDLFVIHGDLTKNQSWKNCGIVRAKSVLIAPGYISDMHEINHSIKETIRKKNPGLIINYSLYTLDQKEVFSDSKAWLQSEGLETQGFHLAHLTASIAVETFAPHRYLNRDFIDREAPHLILDGFTEFTKSIIIESAHLYHYPSMKNLQISLFTTNLEEAAAFVEQHPGLKEVVDIEVFETGAWIQTIHKVEGKSFFEGKSAPYMVMVFPDNPWKIPERARQWRRFLTLSVRGREAQLNFFLPIEEPHIDMFRAFESEWADLNFKVFGEVDFIDLNQIIDNKEVIDSIAFEINESYRQRFGGKEWLQLSDREKEFNRRSARHLKIKMNLMGYEISDDPSLPVLELPQFSPEQKSMMARLEHKRWNAEKYLDGFIPGQLPEDKKMKGIYKNLFRIHPDIRPFEELNAHDIAKDENTFEDLKTILKAVLEKKRLVKI